MILVFAVAGALWGIGWAMGAPKRARWVMIGVLLAFVIVVHLALPDGHPLRQNTGGELGLWVLLACGAGLVWGYGRLLARVRGQAAGGVSRHEIAQEAPVVAGAFSETELDRYARHIVLREIGGAGQRALKDARVLVVGAGGLGAPALQYLAAAGVGTLGVIDDDVVENSNLQRQVIHTDTRIGMPKVQSVVEALGAQNPFVTVRPYRRRLTEEIAAELVAEYDLVLDGTDNFETRYLVNRVCVGAGVPLIAAALSQWEGQISLYDPKHGTPCYQCIFPQNPEGGAAGNMGLSCAEGGVIGPLPGVIGSMMAVEAIKLICGAGDGLRGRMLIYDALYAQTRLIAMKPRADCPVCKGCQ